MAFTKNIILRVLIAVLVVGAGVYAWKFQVKPVEPESVLPEDTFMLFEADFTNENQRKLVRNLMQKFPEFELGEEAEESFFDDVIKLSKGDRKDLKKVLNGEWKLVVGVQHKDDGQVYKAAGETLAPALSKNLVVFMALKSDKIGKLEDLAESFVKDKAGNEYETGKVDDVDFWYNKKGGYKIYRYGDTVFAASDPSADTAMIARVKAGKGFNADVKLSVKKQSAAPENLGFIYVDSERGGAYLSDIAQAWGVAQAENLVTDSFVVAVADKDGIRMSGESGIKGDSDYKLGLAEKVPGNGVIWYSEQADFSKIVAGMFSGFANSYSPVEGLDDPSKQLPGVFKSYDDVLKDLAKTFDGVSEEEIDKVLKSPFAMSLSYPGGLLPAAGIYLQLDEESVKEGNKLVTAFGNYSNEVVASFDKFVEAQGAPEVKGAFTNEVASVQGGAARKVYLDWKKFPEDLIGSVAGGLKLAGVNLEDIKLEFYYGVTGDNVLFVVFYPDFDKVYGTEFVSQQPLFQAALKDVEKDGFMINFLTLSPLADMIEKYFAIAQPLMALNQGTGKDAKKEAEDLKKKVKTVEDFLRTIKYFVDVDVLKDGVYKSDSFVKF